MDVLPTRDQGHLLVAAIRVLRHKNGRPPTPEEIAELLNIPREGVHQIVRGLVERGVVSLVETPFEVRIEIADHQAIEGLPEFPTGPDMGKEIESFQRRTEKRQEQIERMLRGSDARRDADARASRIEEEFRRFRKRGRADTPFRPEEGDRTGRG